MNASNGEGRSLFVAAGGGGDAIGAWLVARTLTDSRPPAILTWSWDRLIVDPLPGPRNPSEFVGLEQYGERNYRVTPGSLLAEPGGSTLPRLAAELEADLFLMDPRAGAPGIHDQILELIHLLDAPGMTVVDVGGDILASGNEPELLSPLADALVLAAAQDVPVPTGVVVAGPGLDGELSQDTVLTTLVTIAGFKTRAITADDARAVSSLFDWHPSETTGLLCAAAQGVRGRVRMRGAGIPVDLTDFSPTTWVVGPWPAFNHNHTAQAVRDATTLDAAERAARDVAGRTELDVERAKAGRRTPVAALALADVIENGLHDKIDYWTRRFLKEKLQIDDTDLRELLEREGLKQGPPPLVRVPA